MTANYWVTYIDEYGVEQWEVWSADVLQEERDRGVVQILEVTVCGIES